MPRSLSHAILAMLIAVFLLSSCTYKKLFDHTITDPMTSIDYLELKPSLILFNEYNEAFFSDSLQNDRWEEINDVLFKNKRLRINRKIQVEFEYELNEIKNEIAVLEEDFKNKRKLKKTAIPPVLAELMRVNECEYLAIPVINSFIRKVDDSERLFRNMVAINMVTIPVAGVVILPKKVTDPYQIYYRFLVLDRKNNRVAYYQNYPKVNSSIMNDRKLKEMQVKMFRDMYISTNR